MGHKAMVAYEVGRGVFNLHFSEWGADGLKLKNSITKQTPWGGDNNEPSYISETLQQMDHDNAHGHATEAQTPTEVKPEPQAKNLTLSEAATMFDYLFTEAFYVVRQDFTVEAYLPIPYLGDGPNGDVGALVRCESAEQYNQAFGTTRTAPWKEVESKEEWKEQLQSDYGSRVPSISPVNV